MTYYINVLNDKLNGAGTCPTDNSIEVSEAIYNDYLAHPLKYVYQEGEVVLNPNYETEMAQRERERLNALTLTKRQFFLCLLDLFNITPSQVELVIEASASASAKIEFQYASGFLRGNPLFDELSPALGLTPAQVDEVFEAGQEY